MSASTTTPVLIAVGIDTARYGHHATFLNQQLEFAADQLEIIESRKGYLHLEQAMQGLVKRHGKVVFRIRIDAAGQYAQNLLQFLENLPFEKSISVGEPKRNKDYCNVHFPKRKADAVESHACARFAMVENPRAEHPVPEEFRVLRETLSALESQTKRTTRLVNQLHNRLSRSFPELAVITNDLKTLSILTLLAKYPTAERIAAARLKSIEAIPYLRAEKAQAIHQAAKESTASLQGAIVEGLIQQQVGELRGSLQAEKNLEELLEKAFEALSTGPHRHVVTIPGIGRLTAAALVANIISINRFETADSLVNYYGVFPEENASGFDRKGRPVPPTTMRMCQKGNDLIRKLLYMASTAGIRCNPALKALYARQMKAQKRGDVALGHCMRKLLHLVYVVWKTDKPFDPNHYDWGGLSAETNETTPGPQQLDSAENTSSPLPKQKKAAGRKGQSPNRKAVTAANSKVVQPDPPSNPEAVDFAAIKQHLSMAQVLEALGCLDRMQGGGPQRRGPCPVHRSENARSRSFSVHLDKNIFQCFAAECGAKGDVLELWAAVNNLSLRDAAMDLARRHLPQTEKRNP